MDLSDRSKILILIAVVIVALYLLNNSSELGKPIHNEGELTYDPDRVDTYDEYIDNDSLPNDLESDAPSQESQEDNVSRRKMTSRNSAQEEYKDSSFLKGKRGGKSSNLDKFFEETHPFDEQNRGNFVGDDAGSGDLAPYVPGKKRKMTEEDKFNSKELLPSETNKDWFEDVQTTSIKNPHMINIYRPVGVDSVTSSLRNASRDIRGAEPTPRTFVSPWNMSSIEADRNIRRGGLC